MTLLSAISISFSGYVLPVLFYYYLVRPDSIFEKLGLAFIMILGVASCVIGTVLSIMSLVDDVKTNGNPFAGLFEFC